MSKPTIEDQVKALATLRRFARDTSRNSLNTLSREAAEAINTLDDGDVFAALDQERNEREAASVTLTPVAIFKLRDTLFQARGPEGQVWATATTRKGVEERLAEQSTLFLVVTPEQLPQYASGQTYETPRCVHCSDPLDETGGDLATGETFCGANPDGDQHEPEPPVCTYQVGGDYLSPPEYCELEIEPGQEYCPKHQRLADLDSEIGLPELKPGETPRLDFSDTHPRAARELGDIIRGDQS